MKSEAKLVSYIKTGNGIEIEVNTNPKPESRSVSGLKTGIEAGIGIDTYMESNQELVSKKKSVSKSEFRK